MELSKGTPAAKETPLRGLAIILEELAVPSEELTLIGRDFELVEYRVYRANRLAVGAIDARFRVDVIHLLLVRGADTMHRTNFQAGRVLDPDAGFRNHKCQNILLLVETTSRTGGTSRSFIQVIKGRISDLQVPHLHWRKNAEGVGRIERPTPCPQSAYDSAAEKMTLLVSFANDKKHT